MLLMSAYCHGQNHDICINVSANGAHHWIQRPRIALSAYYNHTSVVKNFDLWPVEVKLTRQQKSRRYLCTLTFGTR